MSLGIITGSGWYKFKGEEDSKPFRFAEAVGNPEIRQKCIEKLAHYFRSNYLTIEMTYREAGNTLGQLSDEELESKWKDSNITLTDPNFVLEDTPNE